MKNWQQSYKKHQVLANEIAEQSIAQEVLQTGVDNWEQDEQLLSKGELNHVRLWLNQDELSDTEKQLIAESQKAILNQTTAQTTPLGNNLLIGLISTNIIALVFVASVILYDFTFVQQQTDTRQIAPLEKQISHLKQQTASLRTENQSIKASVTTANQQIKQLTEQKNTYYVKWILQAVDHYSDQPQTTTALLLQAFEHSAQSVFLERLYDVVIQHGQQPQKTLSKHQIEIQHAVFSPDNQYVVTVSIEGFGYLWEVATGAVKRTFMLPDWSPLSYATFSSDSQFLLVAGGKTALIWDMAQQKQIGLLKGHSEAILSASFSDDNQYIATASQDKTARLWKTETGELLKTYEGHTDIVYAVAFSPNSQLIATGSKDGTAKLWQLETAQLVHSLGNYQKAVKYLCFQKNSLTAASFDGQIQSWDIQTAKKLLGFGAKQAALNSFTCQTDIIAASFADDTAHVWKLRNAQPLAQLTYRQPIHHVDLHNNLLVTASESEVTIQNWKTQKTLYTLSHPKRIRQVIISPDGNQLLVVVGELAYIYPLFHSQSAIVQAAESIVGDKPPAILKQYEIE